MTRRLAPLLSLLAALAVASPASAARWTDTFTPDAARSLLPEDAADREASVVVIPVGSVARDAAGALVVTLRGLPERPLTWICDLMDPMMRGVPIERLVLRCAGSKASLAIVLRSVPDDAGPAVTISVHLPSGQTVATLVGTPGHALAETSRKTELEAYHRQRIWYWDGASTPPPGLAPPDGGPGYVLGDRGELLVGRRLYIVAGDPVDLDRWDARDRLKTGLWVSGTSGIVLGSMGLMAGLTPALDLRKDVGTGIAAAGGALLGLGTAAFLTGVLLPADPFSDEERKERVREYNRRLRDRTAPPAPGAAPDPS